jgi:hypothetical protein
VLVIRSLDPRRWLAPRKGPVFVIGTGRSGTHFVGDCLRPQELPAFDPAALDRSDRLSASQHREVEDALRLWQEPR